jgi:hypothetical protein
MINGRFVVFGSPDYLMEKYGRGYLFTAAVNTAHCPINVA